MNKTAPFTIDDFILGDSVYFEDFDPIFNHDFYWKVVGKHRGILEIELTDGGFNERIFIPPSRVKSIEPRPLQPDLLT